MKNVGNSVAREVGTHKALLGALKKPSKMEDDELMNLDIQTKATVILCLSD